MHFEKVKYEAFEHDMMQYRPISFMSGEVKAAYDNIVMPVRKTKYSAGYDICTPIAITIPSGQRRVIPTGIKAVFNEDEMSSWHLQMYVRSSVGIKDGVVLTNGTGVIDSDYYLGENDGDMMLALLNTSDNTVKYNAGDRICQAIFALHGLTSDDSAFGDRKGGIGSTNVKKENTVVTYDELEIEYLNFTVRTYNALRRGGINNIGELRKWYYAGSHRRPIRNISEKTLKEISEKLNVTKHIPMGRI